MAQVTIYTGMMCGYCTRAKHLLKSKDVIFEEIDVSFSPHLREEMMERAGGRRTVPQIFIDGAHVGGCDELMDLERRGKLDPLLGLADPA
ncbi:MAG: glutaredoxin 3 [Alphaproteobacteria bacterium]|nr:MAG: glutaredoxin 3 [Alphaproteobacteria bacterium]